MQKENADSYIITRIINNNVIVSCDPEGQEIVLMGKGISFNRRVGDSVERSVVEKIFILKEKERSRYLDSIEHIPTMYMDIAVEILDKAEQQLKIHPNPISYIMLADHLNSAVERSQKNIYLENEMLSEIKHFHPQEYAIGKDALRLVSQQTGVDLPIDEAGFVAFHILNQLDKHPDNESDQRSILINKVLSIVENYFNIKLDTESIYYERFMTHLKYFSARVFTKEDAKSSIQKDDFLYRMMRIQYPETTKCVELVQEYLDYNYHISVSDEEKGYLIVHINNLLMKSKIVTDKG